MKAATLGIPSGSLFNATLELLKKLGIKVLVDGKNFMAEVVGSNIFARAMIMRPNDLPLALKQGIVDVALTGFDMLCESGIKEGEGFMIVRDIPYAKKTATPAKVVVFCRNDDSDIIEDTENTNVTSEYWYLVKRVFRRARISFSTGSTEIKVADLRFGFKYGVGITESGESLRDNGLKIAKTIILAPVVLLARERLQELEIFGDMMIGALNAENFQLIKANVPKERLNNVINILPALKSPNVNQLADGSCAIETIVARVSISDVIIGIRREGGRDILVQNLNIMV